MIASSENALVERDGQVHAAESRFHPTTSILKQGPWHQLSAASTSLAESPTSET